MFLLFLFIRYHFGDLFSVTENEDFQLLSCGADKSIIFRSAQKVSSQALSCETF